MSGPHKKPILIVNDLQPYGWLTDRSMNQAKMLRCWYRVAASSRQPTSIPETLPLVALQSHENGAL